MKGKRKNRKLPGRILAFTLAVTVAFSSTFAGTTVHAAEMEADSYQEREYLGETQLPDDGNLSVDDILSTTADSTDVEGTASTEAAEDSTDDTTEGTEEAATEEMTEETVEETTETTTEEMTEETTEASTEEAVTHPELYEGLYYNHASGYSVRNIIDMYYDGLDLDTFFQGHILEGLGIEEFEYAEEEGLSMDDLINMMIEMYATPVGGSGGISTYAVDTSQVYVCTNCRVLNSASGVYRITMHSGVTAVCLSQGLAMTGGSAELTDGTKFYKCDAGDVLGANAASKATKLRKLAYFFTQNSGIADPEYVSYQNIVWSIVQTGSWTHTPVYGEPANSIGYRIAAALADDDYPLASITFYKALNAAHQNVMAIGTGTPIPQKGYIQVNKSSADITIYNANPGAYSMDGATYGIYSDESCATLVTSVTIAGGSATTGELDAGTYYVKETGAPGGYELDTTVHTATVTAGNTTTVDSSETPKTGSLSMNKTGIDSAFFAGNNSYSLEGAVYQVEYWKNDTYNVMGEFKTDSNGIGHVTRNDFDSSNVCSGTPTTADTHTVMSGLPLGWYRVTETVSSKGYALDSSEFEVLIDSGNCGTTQTWTSEEPPVIPQMAMTKVSTNPALTDGNPCYSLAGAIYHVYTDFACTQPATTLILDENGRVTGTTNAVLVTDADGNSNVLNMAAGVYYIKEIQASKGFRLDNDIHRVVLTATNADTVQTFESMEPPLEDPAHIEIFKTDSEGITMIKEGNGEPAIIGGASLAGAVFQVNFYGEYYDSVAALKTVAPTRTWYIETKYSEEDKKFVAYLNANYLANGYDSAELYYNEGGEVTFPLGTVTMQEIKAPDGYALSNGDGGVMTDAAGVVPDSISIMQVRSNSNINPTEANTYVKAPGDNSFETDSTGKPVLVFTTLQSNGNLDITNVITRGDFSFMKEDYETRTDMEDVFFRITSSSGESHIVKTGAGGYYSSASSEVEHTHNTNGYDALYDADGNYIGGTDVSDMECGLWFYGTSDESEWDAANIDNERGSLRYDETYIIEELPCPANEGKQLMTGKVLSITKENRTVWDGNYVNVPTPRIGTMEWDKETGNHISVAQNGKINQVVDTVSYDYLTAEKAYTIKGIIMKLNADGTLAGPLLDSKGNYVRANQTFTTGVQDGKTDQGLSGTVDVSYAFDGSKLSGTRFVIFEYLFEGEDDELIPVLEDGTIDETGVYESHGEKVKHTDETDEDQIGYFMNLHTKAFTTVTGENVVEITEDMKELTVIDTVDYSELTPGYEYKLVSELHYIDAVTGEVKDVLDREGSAAQVMKYFTPEEADGSIDMVFPVIDPSQLLDENGDLICKGMVAYETLIWNNQIMVEHKNPDDEEQTVWTPKVHTTATDSKTEDHISMAGSQVTIIDMVAYDDLAPGKEYIVQGTVMVQDTGMPLKDDDGNTVTAEKTFMAIQSSGTVSLEFTFDASLLAGETVVAFEDLYYKGIRVATHSDINDEEQSVKFPEIHTTLLDQESGGKVIGLNGIVTLIDTVTYRNLIPGKTYTMSGILMNQDTRQQVAADGRAAEVTFIPETESGTIEVSFTFDTRNAGLVKADGTYSNIVCFETLEFEKEDGEKEPVAEHEDFEDEGQTVTPRDRGRVRVLKIGPFISGTRTFTVSLPNGEEQTVTRLSFEQLPFAGITFTVFDARTDKPVTSFTTNADGTAVSDDILFGGGESYYFMETDTPEGLVQSTEKYPVVFKEQDASGIYYTDTLEINNDVTSAQINVYKRGEFIIPNTTDGFGIAQKGIEGVYFGVYANEDIKNNRGEVVVTKDTLVGIAKTNEEGLASIRESLVAGKYYFMELQTATEEYTLDETRFDFEITYKRNTTEHTVVFDVNAENPLLNRFKSRNVELVKTDGEGNTLPGVEFALYRKYKDEYVQIGSYTTGEDGRILIENIPYGDYYFIETKGLEGYEFDGETRYSFTVDDDQPEEYTINLEAVNKRIPETPKTGDSNPTMLVIVLMILAVIATSVLSGHGIYKLYEKAVSEEEKLELQKALRTVAGSTVLAAIAAFMTLVTGNNNMLTMVCGMATMSIAAGVNVVFSTWVYRKEANKTCTAGRETGENRSRRFAERSARKRI